ncbi:MAG: DUF2848 family protein [Chloroflexi bacterium]|nr:DUF2848 family protein [Chloroflexota bacterium]
MSLTVQAADGAKWTEAVHIQQVLLAGYTGRNQEQVLQHIHELAKLGVPAPDRVPAVYVVAPELVTTEPRIVVAGQHTSGEAEFYLIPSEHGLLVGVGSDHTDRAQEAISVDEAKRMCPKPISREVWRYDDVNGHWDQIELRSWVTDAGGRRLYQEGRLGALLRVEDLLGALASAGHGDLRGRIVFGGTLPTNGDAVYGQRFEVELHDPRLRRSLRCGYEVALKDGGRSVR